MRYRLALLCAAVFLVLTACGSTKGTASSTQSSTATTQATFVLAEFKIRLDGVIPAGRVNVKIDNRGAEKHEVVIVAAQSAGALPTKPDGSVDEAKIPTGDKMGESGDVAARSASTKTFTLKPGAYVAFCNIVDDMGMTGTTVMSGGDMPMNGGGSGGSSVGSGNAMGHVHFARGMYLTFTVK